MIEFTDIIARLGRFEISPQKGVPRAHMGLF